MSSSLCPHLVQEYFERVADILTTYRAQILKQVEYDKISENLVLRGAVRQEEHQRIFQCADLEGQVSQMLVVVQNRMWGLENLLAALMEEHVSAWLTQELFRAYTEHLVGPLKRQRENPICQCVQLPNSILYRGWVKALKSLDSLILKTGTSLGFIRQTMYPTDNMLSFLSVKLAEYTGGDSCSTGVNGQDDLVPYGFAPNTAGEVQVAELEDDDINDLFSLSETLCITYHNSSHDTAKETTEKEEENHRKSFAAKGTFSHQAGVTSESTTTNPAIESGSAVIGKPVGQRKLVRRNTSATTSNRTTTEVRNRRQRRFSTEPETTDSDPQQSPNEGNQEKLAKQRELIARLTAPKPTKIATTSSSSTVPLRNSKVSSNNQQRPRSAEFSQRSVPGTLPLSPPPTSAIVKTDHDIIANSAKSIENSVTENKVTAAAGKAQGYVRSKSQGPVSPQVKGQGTSMTDKPTAVAKRTVKDFSNKSKPVETYTGNTTKGEVNVKQEDGFTEAKLLEEPEDDEILKKTKLFSDQEDNQIGTVGDTDLALLLPEMSQMLLSNTIFATSEEKTKSLAYYQLNFDNVSDNE